MDDLWLTIIQLLYVILWVYVYAYVIRLETIGCECAKDWKRSYIKYYVLIMVPLMLLRLVGLLPKTFLALTMFFTLFFIFVVYRYIHELREKKCECSKDKVRDVLEVVNYIQIGLLVFALVVIIGGSLITISTPSPPQRKPLRRVK